MIITVHRSNVVQIHHLRNLPRLQIKTRTIGTRIFLPQPLKYIADRIHVDRLQNVVHRIHVKCLDRMILARRNKDNLRFCRCFPQHGSRIHSRFLRQINIQKRNRNIRFTLRCLFQLSDRAVALYNTRRIPGMKGIQKFFPLLQIIFQQSDSHQLLLLLLIIHFPQQISRGSP